MSSSQLSPRFVVFVVVSLITHLLELAASGLFCHMLIQQGELKTPWFSVSAGLLIIPLVAVQLASAVLLLRRKGETSTTCEVSATAVLHVLQLGFISRHFAILQEAPLPSKRAEVVEMLILRISFGFTSGCTLFLMQVYLLFRDAHEQSWIWAVYVSGITMLVSITWAISTFRRCVPELDFDLVLITWPGTILRFLWRGGEILTRIIALGLFGSLYTHWLFLVVGLHWLAMLVCVCIPVMTSLDWRTTGSVRRTFFCIMTSFAYIFAFINTSAENAVFRYTFYYVVLFLENSILIAIWLIQSTSKEFSHNSIFVYIAAISFVVSITTMIVYYKFFHAEAVKTTTSRTCGTASCVTCKLGDSSSHPPIPPRPGTANSWLSQYQSAVICGQYYKHNPQDSLLDSVSDRNSSVTASSSHVRLQQKLATIGDDLRDGDANQNKHQAGTSSISNVEERKSSKNKAHKKGGKKWKGRATTSESEISSARTDTEQSEDNGSQKRPVWLPSGDSNFANQLLTYSLETFDTAETADDERSSVATGCQGYRHRESVSPRDLVSEPKRGNQAAPGYPGASYQRNGDHNWYSDGYSTDRTLDWPKMPMTSLQRSMWSSGQDTESEDMHCCECSHGDAEVSSIMRSITAVPELGEEGKISHRRHSEYRCPHHHHHKDHHHHRHHISPRNEDSSGVSRKHRHDKLSPRDLASVQEKMPRTKRDSRNEILSSPASDPSYGPKAKRKHSPRRKLHTAAHQDKTTSHSNSREQHSISENLPQNQMCSAVGDIDNSLAQSDKLAAELLKGSAHVSEHRKNKDRLNSNSSSTSDPRFNVRVMAVADDQKDTCTSDASSSNVKSSKKQKSSAKNSERAGKSNEKSSHSNKLQSGINDENESSTIIDTYSISTKVAGGQIKKQSSATSGSDRDDHGIHSDNQNNTSTSDTADNPDEVVYENIWQVKKGNPSKGVDNKGFVSDAGSSSTSKRVTTAPRDAWYVCSESEDSALPPEALSSSVDGFTASENDSDVSMEIVI